jgi:RNA polymerase sigma-70 factor (ECF subfamily)
MQRWKRRLGMRFAGRRAFTDEDESLIAPFIGALRRFAMGLCHDSHLADDLVQDCLERAISRWHLRDDDGNLKAWLFTILHNEFINDRRRIARRGIMPSLDDLAIEPAAMADQEEKLRVQDVLAAVDKLADDHRALILLIGVEELTYEEAAQVLGIPIGTVMSRLSRARGKLRRLLKDRSPVADRR